MSKIKIYELAKELNVPSREVLEFLNGKNIEVKNHMSALEEADADVVRKSFVKAEAPRRSRSRRRRRRRISCMCSARRIHRTARSREEGPEPRQDSRRGNRCR